MLSRVAALINGVGKDITYKRASASYNSTTRVNTVSTTTTTLRGFVSGNTPFKIGGIIDNNTKNVYIPATSISFNPEINADILTIDSQDFIIVASDKRHIGNNAAMYVLTVKVNGS